MTVKEAILKILEENPKAYQPSDICNLIITKGLRDFGDAKTPRATVSAQCGDFIKMKDNRVRRIKADKGFYVYYHAKYEEQVLAAANTNLKDKANPAVHLKGEGKAHKKTCIERSLHPLLCAFLNSDSDNNFTKTIHHETSTFKGDDAQTWIHPDLVNLRLELPQDTVCQSLLNSLNKNDSMLLSSYEMKRSIHSDNELKHYFFQAVSNSSWANYGWLAALDIDENKLYEEMKRLNQTFGIGIIHLNANAFSSSVLFPAKYRALDFRTIDKLCGINPDIREFMDYVVKLINAQKGYVDSTKAAFRQFCDKVLKTDDEVKKYCEEQQIPIETNN